MTKEKKLGSFLASPEGLQRIKDAKFDMEFTHESLAEAAGVSLDRVKRLFNPHWEYRIQAQAIENIARVLDLQPVDIVGSEWYRRTLTSNSYVERYPIEPDCYVERPPIESFCYQEVLQPGSLLRIKAPKLMGKTLLVVLQKMVG